MEDLHMDGEAYISLHDCRADRVILEDGTLSFFFPEGFWLLPEHPQNPTGETVRTGPARVDYVLRSPGGDEVTIRVFRNLRGPWSLRTDWKLPKLMEVLNEKRWQLEFLYQYPGGWERIIECCLWFPKRPWSRECQLQLDASQVHCRWSGLQTDRVW